MSDLDSARLFKEQQSDTDTLSQVKSELNQPNVTGNVAGVGLEIGTGYAMDLVTAPLLGFGPLGWTAYGAANFTSGALSNWAAQRLRGEEEISWGEIIQSGLLDIVPFWGQKLKGAKGVANIALQSGVRTVVGRQGEEAIDEQRWLTPRETLESALIGGAFGGMFKGVGQGHAYWKANYKKFDLEEAREIFPSGVVQELINQGRIHKIPREMRFMATEKVKNEIGFGSSPEWPTLSAHYQDKISVHQRALNQDTIQWDKRALARRSKIDAQFELDKTGAPKIREVFAGSTEAARRAKAAWSLGEEVTPEVIKIFKQSNQNILDGYNFYLHGKRIEVGKTEGHHKGVVRQIFEASNGLNRKFRIKSANYMQKRIGFELGYHGRNAAPVPIRFHPRVHAIINSRISSSINSFDVDGAARRLGFPENWQKVLTYEERLPLYNEIADAIRESVDAINIMWKVLLSRSDDLTTYTKEEFLDLMLQHNKLDEKLRQIASPRFMAQPKKTGWDLRDTSTNVLNEILSKSGREDLKLPFIGKVEDDMSPLVKEVLNQENGWQLLRETLITGQSVQTVMQSYPAVKLTVKQRNSLDQYVQYIRNTRRGTNIPPVDSTWNLGQDN